MKLSDWLPSVFVEGDGDDIQVSTKKFSQFPTATGEGIQGVGIKDGNNVKFELTTDSIKVNPAPFRNAKGQFIGTPEELAGLENQRDVNNFLYEAINDIEAGDINLEGYATEDWVTEQLEAGSTQEEKVALIEAQIQYRGLLTIDADGKPVWPADQTKDRGGWWAYPSSKLSSLWKHDKLEWIFPYSGEDFDITKKAAPEYKVGDIIQLQISDNEAGAGTSWQYFDTAPVYVEYMVEEVYYPNTQAGNENKYNPAYRVSMSGPIHRYSGSLPNVVKGPQGDPDDAWIQWYPTAFAFGATASDGGDLISRAESKADDQLLQGEIEQIALGLEALLTARTAGQWAYDGTIESGPPRTPGTFKALADMSATENYLALHMEDANGITHAFGDAEVGDYIEVVDMDDPKVYALYVLTAEPPISGTLVELPVKLKDRGADFEIGDSCTIRHFAVNQEDINLSELDDRYINAAGDTMTGTLTVPRLEAKTENGPVAMLIEGYKGNTDVAARITMSNRWNANANGNLTFHGLNASAWFQFNKDLDMSSKGIHSVGRIKFAGDKALMDGNTSRIFLNEKVTIAKAGDSNVEGFTIKGKTAEGNNGDLLSLYHNASGLDAINYKGKQESPPNIATVGYVNDAIAAGGGQSTLPEWTLSPFKSGTMAPGKMAFFDGDANGTNRLEAARGVVFSAIDANGNRVGRTKDGVDWERDFGGALNILYDDEKTILTMARSHGSAPAVIYYFGELDAFTIIWPAEKDSAVTSNITHVVQDQNYKIHCPEIIF